MLVFKMLDFKQKNKLRHMQLIPINWGERVLDKNVNRSKTVLAKRIRNGLGLRGALAKCEIK